MEKLKIGDRVQYLRASAELLSGLDPDDQDAIRAAVGEIIEIASFDEYGHVELEWVENKMSNSFNARSIWVDPCDVERVSKDTPLTLSPLSDSD